MKSKLQKQIDREKYALDSKGYICHFDVASGKYTCYEDLALYNAIRWRMNRIRQKHCK